MKQGQKSDPAEQYNRLCNIAQHGPPDYKTVAGFALTHSPMAQITRERTAAAGMTAFAVGSVFRSQDHHLDEVAIGVGVAAATAFGIQKLSQYAYRSAVKLLAQTHPRRLELVCTEVGKKAPLFASMMDSIAKQFRDAVNRK